MNKFDIHLGKDSIRYRDIEKYDNGVHAHDNLQITIPLAHSSCQVSWMIEDGTFEHKMITPGEICLVPPMLEHRFNWMNKAHFLNVHLEDQTLSKVIAESPEIDELNISEQIGIEDDVMLSLGPAIVKIILSSGENAVAYYQSIIQMLAHHVLQNYSDQIKPVESGDYVNLPCPKIKHAINYIYLNLDRTLSVKEIADNAGMSVFHFQRTFKKMIGMTPARFQSMQRVEKARELILNTSLSMAEISLRLGFSSQAYFSSTFSKFIGMSPAKFRRLNQP